MSIEPKYAKESEDADGEERRRGGVTVEEPVALNDASLVLNHFVKRLVKPPSLTCGTSKEGDLLCAMADVDEAVAKVALKGLLEVDNGGCGGDDKFVEDKANEEEAEDCRDPDVAEGDGCVV